MKYLFSMLCVVGLAVLFGLSDRAPAATELVTPDDVQMVLEDASALSSTDKAGRGGRTNGGRKYGKGGKNSGKY